MVLKTLLWIKLLNFQITRTITLTDSLKRSYQALPQGTEYDAQRQEYAKAWEEAINKQISFTRDFIIKHATSFRHLIMPFIKKLMIISE